MTRFNTGNPIGSNDPRDRDDNSKNLDVFMHTEEDDFDDRLGQKRKSLRSIENEAEGLLIAGGKIFETEAEGRAAAEDGQYFFAESPDPDVSKTLYQRVSESESRWVADDPSAEFVKGAVDASTAALKLASSPSRLSAAFHTHDGPPALPTDRVVHFTDAQRNSLAGFNRKGHFTSKWSGIFHTHDSLPESGFAQLDKKGRVVSFTNAKGQVRSPWFKAFHTHDTYGSSRYLYVSRDRVPVFGVDAAGRPTSGGGGLDPDAIPNESFGIKKPDAYWDRGRLAQAVELDEFLTTDDYATFTHPHTKQYDFFDELMSRHPNSITKQKLGESAEGADIDAYTFDFTPTMYGTLSEFDRAPPIELIVTGGLHGNEVHAQMIVMILARGIADKWRDNPVYSKLRWQCIVHFVPCCNPDGIDAFTRRNANNVDLNRNFPTDWESSNSYSGPSPASEPETQVLMNLPDTFPGAHITVDMHTHWGRDYYLWAIATNQRDYNLVEHYCREMMYYQVAGVGDDEFAPRQIYPSSGPTGTMVRHFGKTHGKAAFLHETPHGTLLQRTEIPNGTRTHFKRFGLHGALMLLEKTVDREIAFVTNYEVTA